MHGKIAESEHHDDSHQHLSGFPSGTQLALGASIHVHGERVHLSAAAAAARI